MGSWSEEEGWELGSWSGEEGLGAGLLVTGRKCHCEAPQSTVSHPGSGRPEPSMPRL